jgi:hypothetical protein
MIRKTFAIATMLLVALFVAQAQSPAAAQAPTLNFDRTVYITCREAQAMQPEARKALAYYLAEYSARYHGVTIPEDARGAQLAYLVRGGCTLEPDALLFAVVDHAIVAEMSRLPRRQ